MNQLKIAVAGASGRMGHMLIETILEAPDAKLAGALDIAASPAIGTDAAAFLGKPSGILIESDFSKGLADADFLIDFTRPEGTLKHLEYCAAHNIKMIKAPLASMPLAKLRSLPLRKKPPSCLRQI